MFEAAEKDALRPLPAEPFVLATWATAKIGPDIHAQVDRVLYSVPWQHIGKTADVRITGTMVQFFIGGQLVKTHPRKVRGKQTDFGDYPPEKIAFHMRTPAWCRRQAAGIGPACEQVITELLAENALYRLRSAQGVIGLADKYDPARLEAACAKAITAGDPSYRTIKGILAAGTDRDTLPAAAGDGGAPAFLRGPASFANVIPLPGTSPATRSARERGGDDAVTAVTVTDRSALAAALRNLKLSGMLDTLDARLAQAHAGELGHLDFLQVLCQDEISRRDTMSLARRIRRARFETPATLEGFDFGAAPKLPAAQIRDLAALRWLASGESVILYGPVGVGKSHIAQALAHLAIRAGAEARFMKTSRALAHLAGGHADRTWDKRLAELTRPAVLVLDDFAMRELTAAQADDLYELITERAGKSLILTSNRAPADWYPLFPNPVVAESLLDRLINNSHQVFMNGPSYRPNKRPGRVVPTGNTSGS